MATPPIRVMLVDDSALVRGMMAHALQQVPEFEVTHSVADGQMALNNLKRGELDVIILDLDMPRMDGLTALPKLLSIDPKVKILICSNVSGPDNVESCIEAMRLGASEYLPKPSSYNGQFDVSDFHDTLVTRIKALVQHDTKSALPNVRAANVDTPVEQVMSQTKTPSLPPKAIAIASSTGGPKVLLEMFAGLKNKQKLDIPIFITQHMPASFTEVFARHLATASTMQCHEAKDGETAQKGHVYIAPGNWHMVPQMHDGEVIIRLSDAPPVNYCRPAADPMLEALSGIYGNRLLLLVLTGMGQDALAGARLVKDAGGFVATQDKESSVVWGMPGAISKAGLSDATLPANALADYVSTTLYGRRS